MTRPVPWEYRVEPSGDLDEGHLDALGRDGWELATIDPAGRAIFKRPGPVYRERITLAQRERVEREIGEDARRTVKRGGILHPGISHLLASTGHTDYFLITDRGFPVPPEPERIDLALVDDLPTVLDVLKAVQAAFTIDRIVIAGEMERFSPERVAALRELLGDGAIDVVSHIELKRLGHDAKATIRTGDATPYANLIVVSG